MLGQLYWLGQSSNISILLSFLPSGLVGKMPQETRPFRNSNLFSNHYLEKLVKESPEWREAEGLKESFTAIKEQYERKARVLENYNESQLEESFIRPVLRILGHHFGVQGAVFGKGKRPDYALFPDAESQNDAEARPEEDYYRRAIAVGDAKAWKVSLDKQRGRGSIEMQNPSFQIDSYLRDTPPKWAILTNGRFWRLYHETTSYKLDSYYEVDLAGLLAEGDLEAFKYFHLFFSIAAFPRAVDGDSFLDRVREGSVSFAQEIQEDLQKNVYRAMKILAEGFLAEPGNGLDAGAVREVQENALRLLYRLLFIFYAESRGLLDTDNKYYYELSLQRLKAEIAARLDRDEPLLSIRYAYWESCKGLFSLINDGSESRGISKSEFYIPAYNGGLFDPEKNAFLEHKRIGDSFLASAIDLLARSASDGFVDYSSLEIRHLGSIYEGLLEYRLKVAEQEMAAVKEKGKELWLPSGEAGMRKVVDRAAAGELYLATDKGERKATGSYYTPDYIVKYIVKNTIEPVIEKKKQEWLGTDRPFADYILSIKVLDPAMGSGHFLVEATDQLARWLVQAWETARPEDEDSKDVAEQDVHWARREVVRSCIFGVDLNPMAVELAKLSLWLTTVASNKPLSFLDHHLRCGNSLIGAELSQLTVLPGKETQQPPLWKFVLKQHTDSLLNRYSLMAALPDDSLRMVKWKEEQFRQIQESELSRRLQELANVWLSTFFGNEVSDDDYYELQNHLSPEKFPDWGGLRGREWFRRAQALAQEKRFFHWELEFPEAFNGEGRGFDVVVGNPPYFLLQGNELQNPLSKIFPEIFSGSNDISHFFFAKGVQLVQPRGYLGYIVTRYWMEASLSNGLRLFLTTWAKPSLIIDFGNFQVWPKVNVLTVICILRKAPIQVQTTKIYLADESRFSTAVGFFEREVLQSKHEPIEVDTKSFSGSPWYLRSIKHALIWEKMRKATINLDKITKNTQGIKTGNNKAFTVLPSVAFELGLERDALIPVAEAQNVQRYYINADHFVIYTDGSFDIEKTPVIKSYLSQFKNELSNRAECNHGSYPWWRLQRPRERELMLRGERILVPLYSTSNRFYFSKEVVVGMTDIYVIVVTDNEYRGAFLSAVLNSKLLNLYHSTFCKVKRAGYLEYSGDKISNLPIRRISFVTPAPERARLGAELQELYGVGKFDEILASVEVRLPKDAQGNFIPEQEKSDVVHDLLAFLAERMLEMNKEMQQEIKGFLGWLEGEIGAKVQDLSPKTKLQSYYDYDYDDFYAVLKKNKKRLSINPSSREKSELLKDEFGKSVAKLGPLQERIERADRLIDAVVYRLYGLTEEEIRIVEGRTS